MNIKARYALKLLFGLLFVVAIAYFGYWLLAVYKVENVIGQIAIVIFITLPLLKTILSLPGELRMLILVCTSNNPEEIEEAAAQLRDRGAL